MNYFNLKFINYARITINKNKEKLINNLTASFRQLDKFYIDNKYGQEKTKKIFIAMTDVLLENSSFPKERLIEWLKLLRDRFHDDPVIIENYSEDILHDISDEDLAHIRDAHITFSSAENKNKAKMQEDRAEKQRIMEAEKAAKQKAQQQQPKTKKIPSGIDPEKIIIDI